SSPLSCRPSSRVPCNRKGKLLRLAKERSKGEKGRSRGQRITVPCSSPPLRRKGAMQGGGSVRSKPRTHGAYAPTLEGRMPHAPYFELLSVFNSRPNPGKWKPMPLAKKHTE